MSRSDLASQSIEAAFEAVVRDVRVALRLLRRDPAFATAAILTIALGTLPLTATMGLANGVFQRPAPGVTGAGDLVAVSVVTTDADGDRDTARLSYANRSDLVAGARSLTGLAGHTEGSVSIAVPGVDARYVDAVFVTHDYFPVLGMRMAAGRAFAADEDRQPGGSPVVVIGQALASSLFGDPERATGRSVLVNGLHFTIVGVAPSEFRGLKNDHFAQVWIPGAAFLFTLHSPRDQGDANRGLFDEFIARLAPDARLEQARAELTAAARALTGASAAETARFQRAEIDIEPQPGMSFTSRNARRDVALMVTLFACAGALLLLLAGANVGNLFLFRSARRRGEFAVRSSLGASRWQLLRAHLVEVAVISLSGGALGLILTAWLAQFFGGLIIPEAGLLALPIDWRVAGLVLAGAVVVGLVFGGAPAVFGAANRSMAFAVRGAAQRRGRRLRNSLTVMQLAVSLALLVGAVLLLATIRNLVNVDIGVDVSRVASARVSPIDNGYDDARTLVFYRELAARAAAMPGIASVSVSGGAPMLGGPYRERVQSAGKDSEAAIAVVSTGVTSDYFRVLDQPLLRGRSFSVDESFARPDGACGPVIVSESLAVRLFGARDAVGRVVVIARNAQGAKLECPVVGVAADVRWNGPGAEWTPILYRPLGRTGLFRATLLARFDTSLPIASASLREAAASIDPGLPLYGRSSLMEGLRFQVAGQRIVSTVLGSLAAFGLLMAAVGLYGLVAETVVDRTREFAVRMSVGAGPRRILWAVLHRAIVLAAIGIAVGIVLSAGLSQAIRSQLFGVSATAPWAYLTAAGVLVAVVILASLVPAVRATRMNLVDVLRAD